MNARLLSERKKRRRQSPPMSTTTTTSKRSNLLLLLLISTATSSIYAEDTHVLRSTRRESTKSDDTTDSNRRFMVWCEQVLGIHSILEVTEFEYQLPALSDDHFEDDLVEDEESDGDGEVTLVRGLAASRDIQHGEVVLQVPMQALFSISVVIDQDPVLRPILSHHHEEQVAVLAIALLHHVRLGDDSPLAPYIRIITTTDATTALPTLWSASELRERTTAAVRRVAQGLRREVREAYANIVTPLLRAHPSVLDDQHFSFEKFKWAYAVVNSRHWQLPIAEANQDAEDDEETEEEQDKPQQQAHGSSFFEEPVVPPADTPTDSWVRKVHSDEEVDMTDHDVASQQKKKKNTRLDHSFLAPVADLLNFGPPCTRIRYDSSNFEVVATCDFTKGQEVTFWYGDDCADIIFAVYGVSDAMIQPCKTAAAWKQTADDLNVLLETAYLDLELLESELDTAESLLVACCESRPTTEEQEANKKSKERKRIRRTWSSIREEQDL